MVRNKLTLKGLQAYSARLGYLYQMQPKKDLDILKINNLTEDSLFNNEIDLNTISEFQIGEHSKFLGFSAVKQALC